MCDIGNIIIFIGRVTERVSFAQTEWIHLETAQKNADAALCIKRSVFLATFARLVELFDTSLCMSLTSLTSTLGEASFAADERAAERSARAVLLQNCMRAVML